MKYILILITLIAFAVCEPPVGRPISAEEAFIDIKKKLIKCIVNDQESSLELKNYANEVIAGEYKETLNLSKFKEKESDWEIIRKCRRNSFMIDKRRKLGKF